MKVRLLCHQSLVPRKSRKLSGPGELFYLHNVTLKIYIMLVLKAKH